MDKTEIAECVGNWRALNQKLKTCTELEAVDLLQAEIAGRCRPAWLIRIYGRFTMLRGDRERGELFSKPPRRA